MPTLLVKHGTLGAHPTLIMKDGKLACECCGPPQVPCAPCSDTPLPQTVSLTANGHIDNGSTCANCNDLDGTHILETIGNCQWRVQIVVGCSPNPSQTITYTVSITTSGSSTFLNVVFHNSSTGISVTYRKTLSTSGAPVCRGTHTVPYFSFSGLGVGCDSLSIPSVQVTI